MATRTLCRSLHAKRRIEDAVKDMEIAGAKRDYELAVELSVEVELVRSTVGLIKRIEIIVDSVTLPASEEFDIVSGDTIQRRSNRCTLPYGMAGKPETWNSSAEE